jgi:hypothetical protein
MSALTIGQMMTSLKSSLASAYCDFMCRLRYKALAIGIDFEVLVADAYLSSLPAGDVQ